MTQEEFMAAIAIPAGQSLREHDDVLARAGEELRALPDEQQFQILFPIALKSQNHGNFPVLDAATLLHRLSPECPISCEDAVQALLPEWDISIEQVPFYLAARFGPARIFQAVASLEQEVTEKTQKVNLDAVAYWVHVYEGNWPPSTS
jgi:hypothetical protein